MFENAEYAVQDPQYSITESTYITLGNLMKKKIKYYQILGSLLISSKLSNPSSIN
jgi:hypothetical protein